MINLPFCVALKGRAIGPRERWRAGARDRPDQPERPGAGGARGPRDGGGALRGHGQAAARLLTRPVRGARRPRALGAGARAPARPQGRQPHARLCARQRALAHAPPLRHGAQHQMPVEGELTDRDIVANAVLLRLVRSFCVDETDKFLLFLGRR